MLHRRRELDRRHHEVPVAGDADDDPVRVERLGGERGGNAIAHRARPGRDLRPVLAELVEPMRPHGEVARAAGEDGVRGQVPAQEGHHLGQVEVAGKRPRLEVREVVGSRGARPVLPRRRFDGKDPLERGRELGQVGHDRAGRRRTCGRARPDPGGRGRASGVGRGRLEQRVADGSRRRRDDRRRRARDPPPRPGARSLGPSRSSGAPHTHPTRCRRSPGSETTSPPECSSPRRTR